MRATSRSRRIVPYIRAVTSALSWRITVGTRKREREVEGDDIFPREGRFTLFFLFSVVWFNFSIRVRYITRCVAVSRALGIKSNGNAVIRECPPTGQYYLGLPAPR